MSISSGGDGGSRHLIDVRTGRESTFGTGFLSAPLLILLSPKGERNMRGEEHEK